MNPLYPLSPFAAWTFVALSQPRRFRDSLLSPMLPCNGYSIVRRVDGARPVVLAGIVNRLTRQMSVPLAHNNDQIGALRVKRA